MAPFFGVWVCFSNMFLSAGRMRFKNKARKKVKFGHFPESKIGPPMLRNLEGPIFDSGRGQLLTSEISHIVAIIGVFSTYAETTSL